MRPRSRRAVGLGMFWRCSQEGLRGPGRPGWLPTQVPHRSGSAGALGEQSRATASKIPVILAVLDGNLVCSYNVYYWHIFNNHPNYGYKSLEYSQNFRSITVSGLPYLMKNPHFDAVALGSNPLGPPGPKLSGADSKRSPSRQQSPPSRVRRGSGKRRPDLNSPTLRVAWCPWARQNRSGRRISWTSAGVGIDR